MATSDYYRMLSLAPDSRLTDIRRQYRELSLRFHPDHGGSEQQMSIINEAYRVLSDPLLKYAYDQRFIPNKSPSKEAVYSYNRSSPSVANVSNQRTDKSQFKKPEFTQKKHFSFWKWYFILLGIGTAFLLYEAYATFK